MFCPFRRVPFLPLVDRHLEVLDPLFEVGLSMTLIGLLGDLQRNFSMLCQTSRFSCFPLLNRLLGVGDGFLLLCFLFLVSVALRALPLS